MSVAALGKAGGNDDGGPRFLLMAFSQHAEHFVIGHDDADEVGRFGQVARCCGRSTPLISS